MTTHSWALFLQGHIGAAGERRDRELQNGKHGLKTEKEAQGFLLTGPAVSPSELLGRGESPNGGSGLHRPFGPHRGRRKGLKGK